MINGRKIKPAPREEKLKRRCVYRGRTASQEVMRIDWATVQKRAASRRREVRRVKKAGRRLDLVDSAGGVAGGG